MIFNAFSDYKKCEGCSNSCVYFLQNPYTHHLKYVLCAMCVYVLYEYCVSFCMNIVEVQK